MNCSIFFDMAIQFLQPGEKREMHATVGWTACQCSQNSFGEG